MLTLVCVANPAADKPLTFQVTVMADGEDQDAAEAGFQTVHWKGAHFGYNGYKASDGQRLSLKYGEFRTEDEARRYFEWSLEKAAQVIKKGDRRDAKGKVVGLRAEVSLKSGQAAYAVMWTEGAIFREVSADDLAHAVALEKQYSR